MRHFNLSVQTEWQLPIRYNIGLVLISDGIVSISKAGQFLADARN
jgi:hypothetical protein